MSQTLEDQTEPPYRAPPAPGIVLSDNVSEGPENAARLWLITEGYCDNQQNKGAWVTSAWGQAGVGLPPAEPYSTYTCLRLKQRVAVSGAGCANASKSKGASLWGREQGAP